MKGGSGNGMVVSSRLMISQLFRPAMEGERERVREEKIEERFTTLRLFAACKYH